MKNITVIDKIESRKNLIAIYEEKMESTSKLLFEAIKNPKKLKAVNRLSMKLHEITSSIIELKADIEALELEAITTKIDEGEYIVTIVDGNYTVIQKKDGSLKLSYMYMKQLLVGEQVYSCHKRNSGVVNGIEIYENGLSWSRYKGSIGKQAKAEIAIAEGILEKHISFVGAPMQY